VADIAYPIAERTLANGLRVVVSEDHTVPTVTLNIWVNVGSRHEPAGRTGFAHLFEHLMFQGSRNVKSGEHFSALMAEGGRLNATTWFDRTNYFETIPKGALDLALWLEADRHGHLLDAVTQENLDNQRDVVKEEKRQRYDNVPYGNALVDVYATVFPEGHPYHHPTIGSMEDLDAASLEDVHAFFRHYYGPNNMVLTIVGDVEPEEAFAKVERYFGALPASAQPPPHDVHHLDPLAEPGRLVRLEDVPNDRLHLAWRLPVDSDDGYLAASLAVDALGGLSTSRLVQRLVRDEQSATAVHAHTMGFVDGVSLGLLIIDVAAGTESDAVEAAVVEELERFITEGPSDVEMESALAETERSWLSSLASQEERADLICHYTLLADDSHYVNTLLDRVGAIGKDDVRSAAAAYLQPRSRAVVSYLVEEQEAAA
jgi:predicted Zn-dependent peptidase